MDIILIKIFFNYDLYIKYYNNIDIEFIKNNSFKLIDKLLLAIEGFHEKYPKKGIESSDELEVFYFTLFPATNQKEREILAPIFSKLQHTTVTVEQSEEYLSQQKKRTTAGRLALLAIQVSEGNKPFSDLLNEAQTLEETEDGMDTADDFVVDDNEEGRPPVGIRWRQQVMNEMLGSLRKGNFGFIFARPETGKTTLLADFSTHAASQVERPILWFNNEQPGLEVLHRCIQSYFGISSREFYSSKQEFSRRYVEETGNKIRIIDDAAITKRRVEELCRKYEPSLIIFDQIDKIRGFESDRNDLELKEIYRWARELAKSYGPVIGVCQAGGTGEGKKWLTMDDVDGSKTAKQGEADWILGVGKSHQEGMESIRHLHLCKNKLLGDDDTISELRHGKSDIILKQEIARYEDIPKRK